MPNYLQIAGQFEIQGQPVLITEYGTGHIHDTYLLESKKENKVFRYILQRINTFVFKDPEAVMENLIVIIGHLNRKKTGSQINSSGFRNYLSLINTLKTDPFFIDGGGDYWRCFEYIPDTITYGKIEKPNLASEGAKLYGDFIRTLSDLSPLNIRETIPDFHNITNRLERLMIAIRRDVAERKQKSKEAIRKVHLLSNIARIFAAVKEDLPVRVVHNDTKINNILFHKGSDRGICVIDFDTVMPGSLLFDFGDMVRSFTNAANEDERDLNKVYCRLDIFNELVKGFIPEIAGIITPAEKNNLLLGCKLIIYMQAVRFLTDYLAGDVYYKIHYEDHNLVRARNQFKLLESVFDNESQMNTIIRQYV